MNNEITITRPFARLKRCADVGPTNTGTLRYGGRIIRVRRNWRVSTSCATRRHESPNVQAPVTHNGGWPDGLPVTIAESKRDEGQGPNYER